MEGRIFHSHKLNLQICMSRRLSGHKFAVFRHCTFLQGTLYMMMLLDVWHTVPKRTRRRNISLPRRRAGMILIRRSCSLKPCLMLQPDLSRTSNRRRQRKHHWADTGPRRTHCKSLRFYSTRLAPWHMLCTRLRTSNYSLWELRDYTCLLGSPCTLIYCGALLWSE